MTGRVQSTLFVACTRPAMKWGVPFEGFLLNVIGSFFFGMAMGSPLYWLVAVVIHLSMRAAANEDHHCFRVFWLWVITKGEALGDPVGGSHLRALRTKRPRKADEVRGGL